jgi:hypothetical protein
MSFYLYARRSGAAAGCPVIPFAAGCFLGLGFILGTMHIRETSVASSDERHTLYLGSNKSITCRHAGHLDRVHHFVNYSSVLATSVQFCLGP